MSDELDLSGLLARLQYLVAERVDLSGAARGGADYLEDCGLPRPARRDVVRELIDYCDSLRAERDRLREAISGLAGLDPVTKRAIAYTLRDGPVVYASDAEWRRINAAIVAADKSAPEETAAAVITETPAAKPVNCARCGLNRYWHTGPAPTQACEQFIPPEDR